jgi:hypothetical protein
LLDCHNESRESGRTLSLKVFIAGRNRLENEGAKALSEVFKVIIFLILYCNYISVIFPLASVSRPTLGSTQPPVQWVPGVVSLGLKRSQGVTLTTHPHLSAEVENE